MYDDEIKSGRYRHFKGNEYEVIGIAKHSETLEKMVVYRALYGDGDIWVRPISMWNETVLKDGVTYKRFTYIGEEKKYKFYGSENADVAPKCDTYPHIYSPKDLYDALFEIWSADTCAPRMRKDWSLENKTLGQCSITAFLVQDIFGGKVYGIPMENGNYHCYNVVGDCVFDLTSEQFGEKARDLVYENNPEQTRDIHFAKEEKRLRYEMLKDALLRYTENFDINKKDNR